MADLMQQARELLPCPFCGEAAKHTVWGDAGFNKVECTYCDVGMDYFYHQDDAFEAWNRRAALRGAPDGPATHYHRVEGIQGTLSRLRRYAKQGDNKNTLQGQTMEEAAAFIEHALASRPQGVPDAG